MGRYSGEVGGPLTARTRVWRRTMSPSIGSARQALPGRRPMPGPPRDRVKGRLLRLYGALLGRFGHQRWWPGRTPYEVAVGAVLTQHTAWVNAARAIEALRSRRLLTPARVAALQVSEPARVARGPFAVRSRPVQRVSRAARGRRQVALPHPAALPRLPAAPGSPWPGARPLSGPERAAGHRQYSESRATIRSAASGTARVRA